MTLYLPMSVKAAAELSFSIRFSLAVTNVNGQTVVYHGFAWCRFLGTAYGDICSVDSR